MRPSTSPRFWRHNALPFFELRYIRDGREVSYVPHYHEQWSIGAILQGNSAYLCAERLYDVAEGDLVIMDPYCVHACNPKEGSPWSYYMMHVDAAWLGAFLYKKCVRTSEVWSSATVDWLSEPDLFANFNQVAAQCFSEQYSLVEKQNSLESFLYRLFTKIDRMTADSQRQPAPAAMVKAANYLLKHCDKDTPIQEVAADFGYSAGYFTRQFRHYYSMTPHAFRLNRRVQLGQIALKNGQRIADVANQFGFNDQAHFQRAFKARVAATPKQYMASVQNDACSPVSLDYRPIK